MYEDLEDTSCRLVRRDGTRWSVLELDLSDRPSRARVVPEVSSTSHPDAPRGVSLARGDRLEWCRADGTVAWAARMPVTSEPALDGASEPPTSALGAA